MSCPVDVTFATPGPPLLQAPPAGDAVIVVVLPTQISVEPTIDPGFGLIVITRIDMQPVDIAYVMFVIPDETPYTRPVGSIVAMEVLRLVHVPPAVAQYTFVVLPTQADETPVILAGRLFTVTTVVEIAVPQVKLTEYVSITVPAETPFNTPVRESTDAIIEFAECQTPPSTVEVTVAELPTQTEIGEIVPAVALVDTVTVIVDW